jgi:hypothetical protein
MNQLADRVRSGLSKGLERARLPRRCRKVRATLPADRRASSSYFDLKKSGRGGP